MSLRTRKRGFEDDSSFVDDRIKQSFIDKKGKGSSLFSINCFGINLEIGQEYAYLALILAMAIIFLIFKLLGA